MCCLVVVSGKGELVPEAGGLPARKEAGLAIPGRPNPEQRDMDAHADVRAMPVLLLLFFHRPSLSFPSLPLTLPTVFFELARAIFL